MKFTRVIETPKHISKIQNIFNSILLLFSEFKHMEFIQGYTFTKFPEISFEEKLNKIRIKLECEGTQPDGIEQNCKAN